MKKISLLLAASLFFSFTGSAQDEWSESCTSIMVGTKASTDGSVITSHTCDGKYRTWAVVEPAADHAQGAMHAVRKGTMKTAFPEDTTGVRLAGEIPEAAHTFAYLNTAYPCLNEKQLAIGETTFVGPKRLVNKNSMFMIEELERIALQRCAKARDAVVMMGQLAEAYGYGDGGECLTVADKYEVWQFEIVGVGADKVGAAWVAQRIPDDCIGVSANIPRIGRINREDKANFLCSDNLEKVAIENGLWDGKGDFIFWKHLGSEGREHNYSDRELFIYNQLAASQSFTKETVELPVYVKPDAKVDIRQVMELFRATYEGTDIDMCKNVKIDSVKVSPVANPWLTTTMRNTLNTIKPGTVEFHRTVSVAWCAYSFVAQLRNWLPDEIGGICWLSVDNPAQTPRIPVFCGNTKLPEAFRFCGQKNYWPDCALWTFRRANKLATLSWQSTKEGFMKKVKEAEDMNFGGLEQLKDNHSPEMLDRYTQHAFDRCSAMWKQLEEKYWVQFGSGF